MAQDTVNNDLVVNGTINCQKINLPASTILDAAVSAGAAIQATKLIHRNSYDYQLFGPTTTVTALTQWLHTVKGATATLIDVLAMSAVQATGADRTVDVDIQKSTGGGAFATVLTATIHFTNGTAIRTAVAGAFSSTSLVAGDIIQAVVTVAGAAGAQQQGLMVTLRIDETPA